MTKTSIECYNVADGETIEQKIERITIGKEPITDGAPMLYSERSDGVLEETDIRTDRFDIAVDATDKISKGYITKRNEMRIEKEEQNNPKKEGEEAPKSGDPSQ